MRRRTKFFIALISIIAVAAIYFLYPQIQSQLAPEFHQVFSAQPIPFTKQQDLHFFAEGWIVCGTPSKFYSWDQSEREPPFTQDDLLAENEEISIVAHTKNYIVTENNRIYDTQTIPFTLVYHCDFGIIYDVKENEDFIVVILQEDESKPAHPYILVKGSDFLISLDGMGNGNYISASIHKTDISFLSLSLDSPVPITRVFHYQNRNELYGVLSLENQFVYDIYRTRNNVILMGIKDILCYNVEGELQWSIPHESEGVFEVIIDENEMLFYFPEKSHIGENNGNVIIVDDKGYSVKTFPKYLSNLNTYNSGYIATEFGKNLVYLSKNGRAIKRQHLNETVNWIKCDPVHPDNLFIRTDNQVLQLYTSDKQEEDSE